MVYAYKLAELKEEKIKLLKDLIIIKKKKIRKINEELIKLQKEYLELIK